MSALVVVWCRKCWTVIKHWISEGEVRKELYSICNACRNKEENK